jgi:hypothetical protein
MTLLQVEHLRMEPANRRCYARFPVSCDREKELSDLMVTMSLAFRPIGWPVWVWSWCPKGDVYSLI